MHTQYASEMILNACIFCSSRVITSHRTAFSPVCIPVECIIIFTICFIYILCCSFHLLGRILTFMDRQISGCWKVFTAIVTLNFFIIGRMFLLMDWTIARRWKDFIANITPSIGIDRCRWHIPWLHIWQLHLHLHRNWLRELWQIEKRAIDHRMRCCWLAHCWCSISVISTAVRFDILHSWTNWILLLFAAAASAAAAAAQLSTHGLRL